MQIIIIFILIRETNFASLYFVWGPGQLPIALLQIHPCAFYTFRIVSYGMKTTSTRRQRRAVSIVPHTYNTFSNQSFSVATCESTVWNSLLLHLRQDIKNQQFKRNLETFMFESQLIPAHRDCLHVYLRLGNILTYLLTYLDETHWLRRTCTYEAAGQRRPGGK